MILTIIPVFPVYPYPSSKSDSFLICLNTIIKINIISLSKKDLNELGYDTLMLFVNTSEEVAHQRNEKRSRTIPADMLKVMWQRVQHNIMKFQQMFGASKFHVIDNSGGLEDPDRKENFETVYKEVQKFLNEPPSKRAAKAWLDKNTKT